MTRPSGRAADQMRPVTFTRRFAKHAEGAVLVEFGDTQVLCTASVEESVPAFLRGKGQGWVTAEYGMLPRSTHSRSQREAARGKQSGRTLEIQRLIGRSLRAVVDLSRLGERSLLLDADVLEADGGTRTAAVTGCYVAMAIAVNRLVAAGTLASSPLREQVAAVSVGVVDQELLLDLDYGEDVRAEVDMNVAITSSGNFVEVQGTAEGAPFSEETLTRLLALAKKGAGELLLAQAAAVRADSQP